MSPASPDWDQRLPGEDPTTPHLEDAINWIEVYEELLAFKHGLIGKVEEVLMTDASPELAHEAGADEQLLRQQAERYERRLAFWRQRARELSSRG